MMAVDGVNPGTTASRKAGCAQGANPLLDEDPTGGHPGSMDLGPCADQLVGLHEAVQRLELPERFAVAAYSELVRDMLATTSDDLNRSSRAVQDGGATRDDPVVRMAKRVGLDADDLRELVALDDDHLTFLVPASAFPAGSAAATRELAVLVVVLRQAAGLEEWTESDAIRRAVMSIGRYDQKNFATTLRKMDHEFVMRGSGRSLALRPSRGTWVRASSLLRRLLESS